MKVKTLSRFTKKVCMILALLMVLSLVPGNMIPGTQAQAAPGYTMISTPEELYAVRKNLSGKYMLANDINLTGYLASSKYGWEAIGTFKGEFDGDGYTISGLWHKSGGAYKGLFSCTENATISNLNIKLDSKGLSGAYEVGGIVGYAKGATLIQNCSVSGGPITVTGGGYAGGIVGKSKGPNGKIVNCIVSDVATTTSGNYSGGIIGVAYKTEITGCYVRNITASGTSYVGGFAGAMHGQSKITGSMVVGNGGIGGNPGGGGGGGNDTHAIVSAKASYAGGFVGAMYEQSVITDSHVYADTAQVQAKTSYAGGFIGTAYENSEITNCNTVAQVEAIYGCYVGGFAGEINKSTVRNAYATGDATAVNGIIAGGFAGIAYAGSTLYRCVALGDVSSSGNYAGGLLAKLHSGSVKNASTVDQCAAYGDVVGKGYVVGGLIGESLYSKVSNSYARGDVSGTTGVGGLVGYFSGSALSGQTVTNCYSTGKVTGKAGTELGAFTGRSGVTFVGTNYYDVNKAGNVPSHGTAGNPQGTPPQGFGTAAMMQQATYVGWDFNNIWTIQNGQTYPYFDFCVVIPEV